MQLNPNATPERLNGITGTAVDAAMAVHRELGPGLLESACEACLAYELRQRGFEVLTQVGRPVNYGGVKLDVGYRVDILIENTVILELKAVERLLPVHEAQLISYLKLSGSRVGLLINFHVHRLRDGLKRMVNHL